MLVEAPTYDRPLLILARLGAEIVPLPMDDEGLDPDGLEHALAHGEKPALLYTIPTFQNPSGRTLSTERRHRIAELAAEHELLVLEDDPYGLVRFEGEAPPTLFELEGGVNVAYSSSFSKTIAPGVRVGYFVLPADLAAALEAVAVSTYISPPFLSEAAVFEFIRRGNFEPNLVRVRGLLGARRDAMLAALEREFPAEARWSRPEGATSSGSTCRAGSTPASCSCAPPPPASRSSRAPTSSPGRAARAPSRLAYSFASIEEIGEGIAKLAELLAAAPTPSRA